MSWVKGHVSRDSNRYLLSSLGRKSKGSAYSYRRLFSSVFVWVCVGALLYAAAPYAMAFRPVKTIDSKANPAINSQGLTQLAAISRTFRTAFPQKRIYMRSGQELSAYYSLPKGAKISVTIRQCAPQPIIEALACTPIAEKTVPLSRRLSGSYSFQAIDAAVYHFDETVTLPDQSVGKRHDDYDIVWRRE